MAELAHCRECGALFEKRRARTLYCSRACAARGRYRDQATTPYSRYYVEMINRGT